MNATPRWRIRRVHLGRWQVYRRTWLHMTGDVYEPIRSFTGPHAWRAALGYVMRVEANNYPKGVAA